MNLNNLTRYIDIAFCLILLPMMIMLLPLERWLEVEPKFVVLLVAWLYIIYVINRMVTIPMVFASKRQRLIALAAVVVTIVGTIALSGVEIEPFGGAGHRPPMERGGMAKMMMKSKLQQQAVWFLFVMVSAFSIAVSLLTKLSSQITRNQNIEFEKKRAELALYKAQINPHFLFNTLNTLYGLIITKSDRAEEAFVQFTSLMKYIYSNGSADKIAVEAEVSYIEQYIELHKLRINPDTEIDFSYKGEGSKLMIAPMLLITFVENAFKHGVSPEVATVIKIEISVDGDELQLMTHNPIVGGLKSDREQGIGIDNCKQRLELLYSRRYSLQIQDNGDVYDLKLNIKLS